MAIMGLGRWMASQHGAVATTATLFWAASLVATASGESDAAEALDAGSHPPWFLHTVVSLGSLLVLIVALVNCAKGPPSSSSSPPPNNTVTSGSRGAIATLDLVMGREVDAEVPASGIFVRETDASGQLCYREVSEDEAAQRVQNGQQVFRAANKQQAGQDIYEAVPTAVAAPSTMTAGSPMDLYATPTTMKLSAGGGAPLRTVSTPSVISDTTYEAPDKTLLTNGPPVPAATGASRTPGRGYVNDQVVAATSRVALQAVSTPPQILPQSLASMPRPEPPPPTLPSPSSAAYVSLQHQQGQEAKQKVYQPPALEGALSRQQQMEQYIRAWSNRSMNRDEVDRLLRGCPKGTFIVRKSPGDGSWVLCIAGDDKVFNLKIVSAPGRGLYIHDGKNANPPCFTDIFQLIQHYQSLPDGGNGSLPQRPIEVLPYAL